MTAKLKVIVYEPGVARGELREIDDTLEALQSVVGGYIEHVGILGGLAVVVNEEGRLMGLPPNRRGFVGPFFVARVAGEEYVSITDADERVARTIFDAFKEGGAS